jgi:hypothetical protein
LLPKKKTSSGFEFVSGLITRNGDIMRIHVECEVSFEFSQTMPMIATLNVHFSRFSDLERPDHLVTNPAVPIEGYRDSFGNWCGRLVAPAVNWVRFQKASRQRLFTFELLRRKHAASVAIASGAAPKGTNLRASLACANLNDSLDIQPLPRLSLHHAL